MVVVEKRSRGFHHDGPLAEVPVDLLPGLDVAHTQPIRSATAIDVQVRRPVGRTPSGVASGEELVAAAVGDRRCSPRVVVRVARPAERDLVRLERFSEAVGSDRVVRSEPMQKAERSTTERGRLRGRLQSGYCGKECVGGGSSRNILNAT